MRIKLSDYVSVKAVDTYGVWPMVDLLSAENLAELARWTNEEEQRLKKELARRRHASIEKG